MGGGDRDSYHGIQSADDRSSVSTTSIPLSSVVVAPRTRTPLFLSVVFQESREHLTALCWVDHTSLQVRSVSIVQWLLFEEWTNSLASVRRNQKGT